MLISRKPGLGGGPTPSIEAEAQKSSASTAQSSSKDRLEDRTRADQIEGHGGRLFQGTVPAVPLSDSPVDEAKTAAPDIRRAEELHKRLASLARTVGKDFKLRLEPGDWWAYHFRGNKITYPVQQMLENSDKANMGVICHELAHRLYSRLPEDEQINNKAFHFLWNSVEDIRINKIISKRYAGVPSMMKELYRDFTDVDARREKMQQLEQKGLGVARAKQFGLAAIYEWTSGGEVDPLVKDPEILAALEEARPALEKATRLPPNTDLRFDDLEGKEADFEAAESFRVIRDELWPIYEKLLKKDIEDGRQQTFEQGDLRAHERAPQKGQQSQNGQESQSAPQTQAGQQPQGAEGANENPGAQPQGSEGASAGQEAQGASNGEKPESAEGTQNGKEALGSEGAGDGDKTEGAEGAKDGQRAGQSEGAGKGLGEGQAGASGTARSDGGSSGSGAPTGTGPVNSENNQQDAEPDPTAIDPRSIPKNPLDGSSADDAATQRAKKQLERSLGAGAKELGGQIHDAEQDRESYDPGQVPPAQGSSKAGGRSTQREWGTTGASGSSPDLGYDGDKDVDFDDLMKMYEAKLEKREKQTNLTAWQQIKKKHRKVIQELVDELGNFFDRDQLPQLVGHFKGGVYDLRRAMQAEMRKKATGRSDPKVFLRRDEPKERNVAVVFCIDCSGSMGNGAMSNMEYAREAFVVFTEAMGEVGIDNGVVMYNSGVSVLKPVHEHKDDREREQMLGKLVGGGDNNDTAALAAAREMLDDTDADQKLVIFLSDGAAVANHAQYVREVEDEEEFKVIGIGIGAGCEQVRSTYRHHLSVENTATLPKKLGDLLLGEIGGDR